MNYIENKIENQQLLKNCLIIPSTLQKFVNTETEIINKNGKEVINIRGYIPLENNDCLCPKCNHLVRENNTYSEDIKHLPIGGVPTVITVKRKQFICPKCNYTFYQEIPFKAEGHFITKSLENFILDLLVQNIYTNKQIALLTGVNRNIIKDIDKKRLIEKYTINGNGEELIKPEQTCKFLGIDEFKLHDGYKYATHIIDYETGHILWITEGKKKQVVYDFIEHVGLDWMSNVEAIACDMNSDFEEAFKEKCPHLKIVYDQFHIVKYLNEKVITPIRIEEQKRLLDNGDEQAAQRLKRTKMILCSSEETLKQKDEEVKENKVLKKGSPLFKTNVVTRKGNYYNRYLKLVQDNELFLIIALIKQTLSEAYRTSDINEMIRLIFDIMEICEATNNKYIKKFGMLLYNHFDGIISHATYKISSGKIEGINNKIKTLRRQAYGYPDDEYFFLKLMDMSRNHSH